MKKSIKITATILTSTLLGATFVQTAYDVQDAYASTTDSTTSNFPTSMTTNDNHSSQSIIISNDNGNTLTPDQIKDASRIIQAIDDSAPELANDFYDPTYAKTISNNIEVRGKAGLTAKAAAKLLKAGLKKLGKKGYESLAKKSGLKLVRLNWNTINSVADRLANFDGKVEGALKKALKSAGFNNYWAGVCAKAISTAFF